MCVRAEPQVLGHLDCRIRGKLKCQCGLAKLQFDTIRNFWVVYAFVQISIQYHCQTKCTSERNHRHWVILTSRIRGKLKCHCGLAKLQFDTIRKFWVDYAFAQISIRYHCQTKCASERNHKLWVIWTSRIRGKLKCQCGPSKLQFDTIRNFWVDYAFAQINIRYHCQTKCASERNHWRWVIWTSRIRGKCQVEVSSLGRITTRHCSVT